MNLKDFRFFDKRLHCVRFIDSDAGKQSWHSGEEVRLVNEEGTLVIAQGDLAAVVEAPDKTTSHLASAGTDIWRIAHKANDHLQLEVLSVQRRIHTKLSIAVDSYLITQLSDDDLIDAKSIDKASEWLSDEFVVNGAQTYVLSQSFSNDNEHVLNLAGRRYALTLKKENNIWVAKRLTRLRHDAASFSAVVGDVAFIDGSVAAQVSAWEIDPLDNGTGSYLSLWEQYSDVQWQQATRAAKKIGYFRYSRQEHTGTEKSRFRFDIGKEPAEELQKRLGEVRESGELDTSDLTFEIAEEPPEWLVEASVIADNSRAGKTPLFGRNVRIIPPYIEVEVTQRRPQNKGVVFLSIQGDKTAHERRRGAYTSIRALNNPMPQLSRLLEGIDSPVERRRTLRALTATARKRFKGEPTPRQKEAVDVGLNTPDVALIVGPPGTGKTQVITALQQRIAEEFSRDSEITHQVLLTSFQHDAVDNVVERSGVFGLPAVKVGGRRFGVDGSVSPVTHWRLNKIRTLKPELEKELNTEPVFGLYQALKNSCLNLRISRQSSQRNQLVKDIDGVLGKLSTEHGISLSQSTTDNWYDINQRLSISSSLSIAGEDHKHLLRLLRGLRTLETSFSDDGLARLDDLCEFIFTLSELAQDEAVMSLVDLRVAAESSAVSIAEVTQKTAEARDTLLDTLRPDYRPYLLRSYISESDCKVLDQIETELYASLAQSRTLGPLLVRYEYLTALEERKDDVERSVGDYAAIVGATCQQAAGEQMIGVKEVSDRLNISFDTVIVDEAARAAPLDLLIPMSMASRRIVLVGDHLQLPHMLEPRVETELQERHELDTVKSELLKISLFEHLHRTFKELHKAGGPQRVVMLDTQFRMHPELGRFVSREFYERRGFDPISSGLPESVFHHDIEAYEGCIATWLDIPKHEGVEKSSNGSRKRLVEAKRCAKEAHEILTKRPDLSVGVITFYSAQRDAIYEELASLGCAEKTEEGWQISSGYRTTSEGEERLRVGSVDAFQGKEFDVVILSVVRTWSSRTELTAEGLNQKLGFLRIPNRINVAMSRQKKLLIVVGDAELSSVPAIEADDGQPMLPGFAEFYELCRGKYGQIR